MVRSNENPKGYHTIDYYDSIHHPICGVVPYWDYRTFPLLALETGIV